MDTSALRDIGLNDSEIRVYFALLELESSTVGPLIERAKVPHSKIYSLLEKLKAKGLASFVVKNKVRHYQASDPKNILRLIGERETALQAQKKEFLKTIIPEMELRRKLTEEKQEALVYETFEGVKAAFDYLLDSLEPGSEYLVFMLGESLAEKRIIRFFQNYHKKRIGKKIRVRLISEKAFKPTIMKYHRYAGMKLRFTSEKLPVGTFIFQGHVMTVVWGEKPTAFVIHSEKNYGHYRDFFEGMWETSGPG